MDITPKDSVETKAFGIGQRISIVIGILTAMVPTVLAAFGGLDWITANLPLLLGSMGGILTGGIGAFVAVRRMRIDAGKASAVLFILFIPCVLFVTGCSTPSKDQIKAGSGWAKNYYTQPNVAEIIHIEGSNVCVTVSGATLLTMSTPLPPKSIIPRDPTWTEGLFDSLKSIAPWVFMGWAVSAGAFDGGGGSSTVNNSGTINNP